MTPTYSLTQQDLAQPELLGKRALLRSLHMHRIFKDSRAMTAWEYGLIAALMTIAILSASTTLGLTTNGAFNTLLTQVNWNK